MVGNVAAMLVASRPTRNVIRQDALDAQDAGKKILQILSILSENPN
jgi:hypothetical protein